MADQSTSVSWADPTGQMHYTMEWFGDRRMRLSGVNLNDGTEWVSPNEVEEPERFGPSSTIEEFFAWCKVFTDGL